MLVGRDVGGKLKGLELQRQRFKAGVTQRPPTRRWGDILSKSRQTQVGRGLGQHLVHQACAQRDMWAQDSLSVLTPQDKARRGPGQPGCCGCLLGRAWGLPCLGGKSVLKGKETRQVRAIGCFPPWHSEGPRVEPSSWRAQGTTGSLLMVLGACLGGRQPWSLLDPTSPGQSLWYLQGMGHWSGLPESCWGRGPH